MVDADGPIDGAAKSGTDAAPGCADMAFLGDGGDMGALIRAHDWASTPLGACSTWPQSLRTSLSICLSSPTVSALFWGPEFVVLYNDAYAPVLAERHPQMLGQPFSVVWSEIWDVLRPQLMSVVTTGQGFATDRQRLVMFRHGRVEETFWHYSFAPVRGEDGEVAGMFVSATDMTGQVAAETALRRSEDALRTLNESLSQQVEDRTAERNHLWNSSPDLLLVIDFEGLFRRVNPAWTTLLGYEPDELVGHHVNEFVIPDDADRTTDAYEEAARGGRPKMENRYRHKDGSIRWISWVAAPVGQLTYAIGRDVTDDKAAAQVLATTQESLRQSQKMEAVGQLTGGLAHDFNNLLAGISGSMELLQTRMAQGRMNDLDRYIVAAQGASKRAAALTHRLLAFTRRQTLDPRPTDVNRLVSGMEDLVRRTVGPAITVEIVGAMGLWPVLVDANQLENALLNLCINARDAMPDGGRLTVETANRWLDDRTARERDLVPGQYVSLCVSDTGAGMTPEVIRRAFDPFFTTKPVGMGTGLGLSMIYGFVQQSGGQVRIYSEVGQGAVVCLYLPRNHGVAEVELPAVRTAVPRARQGETVLVLDDEPTLRMLVTEVLEDLGYTAIEAADGAAGLQVLQSNTRIDLLVTDVGLPGGMNGRQVADAGRAVRPGLKVLFITGYAENAVLSHGHLDPGMQVLTKPFAMDALASRIKELIADGQAIRTGGAGTLPRPGDGPPGFGDS